MRVNKTGDWAVIKASPSNFFLDHPHINMTVELKHIIILAVQMTVKIQTDKYSVF